MIMLSNSSPVDILSLSSLEVQSKYIYPSFIFGTLLYLIIVFFNLLVLLTIIVSKKLHKPMFILLLNLPISDIVGATALFPHLLFSIITENRHIPTKACLTQALFIHIYGTGNMMILSAMAFDRYVAICRPLNYHSILTSKNLIRIIFLVWFINVSMIFSLFMLLTQYKICRADVVDLFCNYPSVLKLVCGYLTWHNYYGIFTNIIILGCPLMIIVFTYVQILVTCIKTNNPDGRRKALQTCCTHVLVFLVLQINTNATYILHRSQSQLTLLRKAFGMSVVIFPPFLDPLIYGLNTRELRQCIVMFLRRNVGSTK
ncbi:putative gustatory receptor clone PTE01 [Oryzias melastigma]|uniref:putative gustatory receptor clone PTE01 n=1 Tax=Oryzias melastigma TaxID=30732 RepID=UPI00168D1436|nr:putative gustatory receptor clone PTE01 [Oryzias melastigma]